MGAASETEKRSCDADLGSDVAAGVVQLAAAPRSIFREGTEDFFWLAGEDTGAAKDVAFLVKKWCWYIIFDDHSNHQIYVVFKVFYNRISIVAEIIEFDEKWSQIVRPVIIWLFLSFGLL